MSTSTSWGPIRINGIVLTQLPRVVRNLRRVRISYNPILLIRRLTAPIPDDSYICPRRNLTPYTTRQSFLYRSLRNPLPLKVEVSRRRFASFHFLYDAELRHI